MDPAEIPKADDPVERRQRPVKRLRRPKVVTGCEGVGGVEADPHPVPRPDELHDPNELFEAVAEIAPLARRVFDDGGHPFGFGKGDVDRFGDPGERVLFGRETQMASGMEIEKPDSERRAAAHLQQECRTGFCEGPRFRVAEVDQVTVMREDLRRAVRLPNAIRTKGLDFLCGEGLCLPLPLVLGEKRESLPADLRRVQRRISDTSRGTHMGAHIFHFPLLRSRDIIRGCFRNAPSL